MSKANKANKNKLETEWIKFANGLKRHSLGHSDTSVPPDDRYDVILSDTKEYNAVFTHSKAVFHSMRACDMVKKEAFASILDYLNERIALSVPYSHRASNLHLAHGWAIFLTDKEIKECFESLKLPYWQAGVGVKPRFRQAKEDGREGIYLFDSCRGTITIVLTSTEVGRKLVSSFGLGETE